MHDPAAECGLLACLIKSPLLIVEAERLVQPVAFHIPMNRYVYEMMLYIAKHAVMYGWNVQFNALGMATVAKYLGPEYERTFLSKTDGMQHIQGLEAMSVNVDVAQFEYYVRNLSDLMTRRSLYRQAREMQKRAMNYQAFPDAKMIALETSSALNGVAFAADNKNSGRLMKLGEYGPDFKTKTRLQYQYPNKSLFHVPCSLLPYLSGLMNGGFRRRGLFIICARPKVGKSTLALAIAVDAAVNQNIPTLYLDTEMSGEEMVSRGYSNMSGIQEHDIQRGRYFSDANQVDLMDSASDRLMNANFYYENIAGKPLDYVQSIMRQFRNQVVGTQKVQDLQTGQWYEFSNPALVVYDWLKLPDGGGNQNQKEYELLGYQTSAIKNAANTLDLAVVAGAQANRGAIGADQEQWENNAESFVAGSDRLTQFCSALAVLRNVTEKEAEQIDLKWGDVARQKNRPVMDGQKYVHPHSRLLYNQLLHLLVQRGGADFKSGIPLYVHRGLAQYEELAGTPDLLSWMRTVNVGKKASVEGNRHAIPAPQPMLTSGVSK